MSKQVKEPFLPARAFNLFLGIVILALIVVRMFAKDSAAVYEMLIFVLAAVENFVGATISFSQKKKVRGNLYAIICTIFLIAALFLAVRYFVFI